MSEITNKVTMQKEMEQFCETHHYQNNDGEEVVDASPVEEEDDE